MILSILSFCKFIHQWAGLICGWFLFILVTSGTLSLFDKEITQWMQPELSLYQPASVSKQALDQAYKLWLDHQDKPKNIILLPTDRYPFLRALHIENKLMQGSVIDPDTGNIIPVRKTAGGYFITALHKTLFINRYWGGLIILSTSILFLLTLLTGLVIHCKDFIKTLFNLQLKASSLRIQLNFHTTIGMFFLPILFIIGISGFLFLIPHYIPTASHQPIAIAHLDRQKFPTTLPPELPAIINQIHQPLNAAPEFLIPAPENIQLVAQNGSHLALTKEFATYDPATHQIQVHKRQLGLPDRIKTTLFGIHKGRSGGIMLRSSYFAIGILTLFCLTSGLIYYTNKRAKQSLYHKIIQGINNGIILSCLISFIAFFWINRLIPVSCPDRISTEITAFFITALTVFSYSFLGTLLNKARFIWQSLSHLLIILCLLLPALDCILNFSLFKAALQHHIYLYLTTDMLIFCIGLCLSTLFRFMKHRNFI